MSVQGSIKKYFSRDDKKNQLSVLSVDGLNEALNRYVQATDDDAFQDVIKYEYNTLPTPIRQHSLALARETCTKLDLVDFSIFIQFFQYLLSFFHIYSIFSQY